MEGEREGGKERKRKKKERKVGVRGWEKGEKG